jgi:hypothetical protein
MKIAAVNNLIYNSVYSRKTGFFQGRNDAFGCSMPNARIQNAQNSINNAFYYPVSFSSSKPRTYSTDKRRLAEKSGDFKISRYNDIPCPACGKKMLNVNKFSQIAEEIAELPPEEYLDCLGKYTEYMRPVEESVYNEINDLSKNTGEKDIRKLVVSLRNKKLPLLQKVQLRKVNKMRSLAKTLPNDEQKVLLNKVANLASMIRKTNSEAPFRRKIMLDRISKIRLRNPKKYEKLQKIAQSFPTSSDMNSAWIVKYSGKNKMNLDWDSYAIALRFLSSSIANTDHIIAYDIENNHDDITNYMSMHNACNSQKSNKPFLQWLNEDKANRIQYMQDYFLTIDKMVKARKITKKKYKNYVAHATQTVRDASKGLISININEHKDAELIQPLCEQKEQNLQTPQNEQAELNI